MQILGTRTRRAALFAIVGLVMSLLPPLVSRAQGSETVVDNVVSDTPTWTRRLFESADGALTLFVQQDTAASRVIKYQRSADAGVTWTAASTVAEARLATPFAVDQVDDAVFVVAYLTGTPDSGSLLVQIVDVSPDEGGEAMTAAAPPAPKVIPAPGAASATTLSVLSLGSSVAGYHVMVGYDPYNSILQRRDYMTTLSQDTGTTWSPGAICALGTGRGVLAGGATRSVCLTEPATGSIQWSQWNGVAWMSNGDVGIPVSASSLPSTTTGPDGAIHLAADGAGGTSVYSKLTASASAWTAPAIVARGTAPVIALAGTSINVFAHETLAERDAVVHRATSLDGVDWREGGLLGGSSYRLVYDHNNKWAFTEGTGDALFALDTTTGRIGNRTGIDSQVHRLNDPTKRLAFSFVPTANADATTVDLWTTASSSPQYRIGLQPDDGSGKPTGHWINEVRVGDAVVSGAFAVAQPANASSPRKTTALLPSAVALLGGVRYHVVAEFAPDALGLNPQPSSTAWMGVESIGGEADSTMVAHDTDGSGAWRVLDRLPRYTVSAGTARIAGQTISPAAAQLAGKYSVVGERFFVPSAVNVTSLRLYLTKLGAPATRPTLRLLTDSGAELFAADVEPTVDGWLDVPASLSLAGGVHYRLVLDDPKGAAGSGWRLATSGTSADSWDGTSSRLTVASDRIGFNDRTSEARDTATIADEFLAFNSDAADVLYLGGTTPFDSVNLTRSLTDRHFNKTLTLQYWNGSAWSALAPLASTLGQAAGGTARFGIPLNWEVTEVNGEPAFWIRVSSTSSLPVAVARVTAGNRASSTTVPERAATLLPVLWGEALPTPITRRAVQHPLHQLIEHSWATGTAFPYDPSRRPADNYEADVALNRTGGDLVVDGAAYAGSIAYDPALGTKFGVPSVTTAPVGLAPYAGKRYLVNTSAVLFEDAYVAADLVSAAFTDSLKTSVVLKTASAPSSYSWTFSLPAGASFTADHTVVLGADGNPILELGDVFARDSVHKDVPTTVTWSGTTVTVHVDHAAGDFLYPILLDPNEMSPRQPHPYRDMFGNPVTGTKQLAAGGYIPSSSIRTDEPCRSRGVNIMKYRPECGAQAHALRKLNREATGEFGPTTEVQWETGPRPVPDECPTFDDEACEVSEQESNEQEIGTKRWRADIVYDKGASEHGGSRYGIYEVKRWNGPASWDEARGQLDRYKHNMNAVRTMAVVDGTQLSSVYSKGWAVWYHSGCFWKGETPSQATRRFYAWVPHSEDNIPPRPDGSTRSLNGQIYFMEDQGNIPPTVDKRADGHQADQTFQELCLMFKTVMGDEGQYIASGHSMARVVPMPAT
jgi:hypothetical protein